MRVCSHWALPGMPGMDVALAAFQGGEFGAILLCASAFW